jgi:hypothetical protein
VASEFILFDAELRDRFVQFARQQNIPVTVRPDEMEGDVVEVPDDLGDEIEEALEGEYEKLMDEQRALLAAREGESERNVLGVTVTRSDGQSCLVRLPGPIARRLSQHFSTQEIHELVSSIAESIEDPVGGPLCRRKS